MTLTEIDKLELEKLCPTCEHRLICKLKPRISCYDYVKGEPIS